MPEDKEVHLQIVAQRITSLHEDVNDMKESMRESMKDVSLALTKLVKLEERSAMRDDLIDRAFKANEKTQKDVENLKDRVLELEKQSVTNKQTSQWVQSVVTGAVVLVLMFAAKQLGLT